MSNPLENELWVCVALDDKSLALARNVLGHTKVCVQCQGFAEIDDAFCKELIRLIDHRIECLVKQDARYAQSELTGE